ncbi:MAG: glycosyltransferase, partial [Shewanella sp.]|nr:glycosyltransferase [Shewanella sp.]
MLAQSCTFLTTWEMLVAHPVASCWGRRMFKLCVVIPVYNHGQPLIAVVARLRELQLPCLLVDDGSQAETSMIINGLAQQAEVNCL